MFVQKYFSMRVTSLYKVVVTIQRSGNNLSVSCQLRGVQKLFLHKAIL